MKGQSLISPLLLLALLAFLYRPLFFTPLLSGLAPAGGPAIYTITPIAQLAIAHLAIVVASLIITIIASVGLAIVSTRGSGQQFLAHGRALASLGQTVPPVAVLALCVPLFGFGEWPILVALTLYGMFPIYENAIAGFQSVPRSALEAADGMGMTAIQKLWRIELPLATPVILEGIRISCVISISTATLGSTIASKGLGEIIISGLQQDNLAFIVQGSLVVAGFAILASQAMQMLIWQARHRLRTS